MKLLLTDEWKALKSGSDVRGIADESKSSELTYLSDVKVYKIVCSYVTWLKRKISNDDTVLKISLGHDTRNSADRLKNITIKALTDSGADVFDCGYSSTPAMFMSIINLQLNGAIEITASHHPSDKNGLKFFTRLGGLNGEDISEILLMAQNDEFDLSDDIGKVEEVNHMKQYAEALRNMICKEINATDYSRPLRGLKIIVDAGNGIGGFYADKVLAPLGADIQGSQFLDYDGNFPNHIPNPEDKTAMSSIKEAVIRENADLGIIFDTDVDRSACVDKNGNEINGNKLIALASAIVLENNEGGTIVTDSVTSDSLKVFIEEELGGKHFRYKRGYRNIIDKQIELNENGVNAPLAIETSGHASFSDNYFLDDGAYLITKIVIKMALLKAESRELSDLITSLKTPVEVLSVKLPLNIDDFKGYGNDILQAMQGYAMQQDGWTVAKDSYEGVRVTADEACGNGWFVFRLSVHDPAMPLNIESDEKGGVIIMAQKILDFSEKFSFLDNTPLKSEVEKPE